MEDIVIAIAAGLGGAFLKGFFDWLNGRQGRRLDLAGRLEHEIGRLDRQIQRLQMLVGALEEEIIALGGDPVRVKVRLAERLLSDGNSGNPEG